MENVDLKNETPTCGNTVLPAVFFWLEKHDWGKWEHVMYVEDFRAGIKNFEILRRECKLTGLTQYRRVYVKSCVHGLTSKLSAWRSSQNGW
jgi:hypothetical protein